MGNKRYHIVLASIGFAVLTWISVNMRHDYVVVRHLPIVIENLKAGKALKHPLPRSVSVRFSGSGWLLAGLYLTPGLTYFIDASSLTSEPFTITSKDLLEHVKLPFAVQAVDMTAAGDAFNGAFKITNFLQNLFAYDWELLHHIFPPDRDRYVANVARLLKPGGRYLSVCFSENDRGFGGSGKYRETSLGTVLYFSSEKELEDLFSGLFTILELKTVEVQGRFDRHLAVFAFMERK